MQGILGETNPTVIKDLYKKYANFYSGEGQREKVTQDLQKAALNAQQIARGKVMYSIKITKNIIQQIVLKQQKIQKFEVAIVIPQIQP